MRRVLLLLTVVFFANFLFAQSDTSNIPDSASDKSQKTPELNVGSGSSDSLKNNFPPQLGDVFKPKLSLGSGLMSFYGDLYSRHFQAPWTSRFGFDLNLSQRLTGYLQLNFNALFGKLGAFENLPNRHENFQSEIRCGGLSLLYDFGHLFSNKNKIRPWISFGVSGFEFLSKTDLYDRNGEMYHYWSDGSIKNMAEGTANSQFAKDLVRDYVYETDIRERNIDGFGKYPERAWAFPVGAGAIMQLTERMDFKIGTQLFLTTTDYIDGITSKSVGDRKGTKFKDNFLYTSFAIQYDLVFNRKKDTLPDGYFDNIDWLAIDNADYDKDGVRDFDDKCQCTPLNIKVDKFGCPLDEDIDGVPDFEDDEPNSPKGFEVNLRGVALTDEYWQSWYDNYFDSTGINVATEIIGNAYALNNKPKTKKQKKTYTVELVRYNSGSVPSDEMAYLLSIGDIKSLTLEDGSTVIYTAGEYKDVKLAVQRRDEFKSEGIKSAKIGFFRGEKYFDMSEDELEKILNGTTPDENADDPKDSLSVTTNTSNIGNNASVEETFAKGDVVYRVQLGSYKNKISLNSFKTSSGVIELKTPDMYRYVSKGCKTIEEAAKLRADFVLDGYPDAFITAYKDGKRIPMNQTKATVVGNEKEDLNENKNFSSLDKSLIAFKIQIGALVKPSGVAEMDERMKEVKDFEKQNTTTGSVRYTTGSFRDYQAAEKTRKQLEDNGFPEAFIIATFKGEIISIQEAMELLK